MTSHNNNCGIPNCAECASRSSSVFCDLDTNNLTTITEQKVCRKFARGEMIYYADQNPIGLFCIQQGRIKIYKVGNDGKEQILRLVSAGDIMGYRSLLSGEAYGNFAVPIEDATICMIPKSLFFQMVSDNRELSLQMLRLLSNELGAAEARILEMARKPMRERLAETLIILKETYGLEHDGTTLSIKLTREELANIIGTATESVIRLLSDFKHENLISIKGRNISILDTRSLLEAANIVH